MLVRQLSAAERDGRLMGDGLAIRSGPLAFRLQSALPAVSEFMSLAYSEHPVLGSEDFCDHPVRLDRVAGLRRWVRPQIRVFHDHGPIFEPMPLGHEVPLLEWALNWCVSAHAHQFLVIHAASLEREGRAVVLPAPPGSGKSTLCAALVLRGWRLLSDELALVSIHDGRLHALARPVSLKNRSIDIIRAYEPTALFSPPTHDTAKGTVALMAPPAAHVRRMDETAEATWLVFPRWMPEAPARFERRTRPEAMMALSKNCFNFGISGREGYRRMISMLDRCDCFDFSYGHLDDAVTAFEQLLRDEV